MTNYDKFIKYFIKQCGGNNNKVKYVLSDELNKNITNNNFVKECIKYILNKNIDSEMANLYIYYIVSIMINDNNIIDDVAKKKYDEYINQYVYLYQFPLFNRIKNVICEKNTIFIETDKTIERINSEIMVVGCGHYYIIDLKSFLDKDSTTIQYYNNHRHDNIFCVDIKLNTFPDLVTDITNPELTKVDKIKLLKNKFKVIILEGFIVGYEKIKNNLEFFLEDGGLILSAGGQALELEEYTIENLELLEYEVLNHQYNDNLGYLLEDHFGEHEAKNILQKIFEGKVNIY